jgi:hypothetical protein
MTQEEVFERIRTHVHGEPSGIVGEAIARAIAVELAAIHARLAALEAGERDRLQAAVTEQLATAERIAGAGEAGAPRAHKMRPEFVLANRVAGIIRDRLIEEELYLTKVEPTGDIAVDGARETAWAVLQAIGILPPDDEEPAVIGTPSPDAPPLTAEQIAAIKPGDEVWQSGDPGYVDRWHRVLWRGEYGEVYLREGLGLRGAMKHKAIRAHRPARSEPAPEAALLYDLVTRLRLEAAAMRSLYGEDAGDLLDEAAAALAAYEASPPVDAAAIRDAALREAAAVARGRVYMQRYRTWVYMSDPKGGEPGNRAETDPITAHSDRIADAILALCTKKD